MEIAIIIVITIACHAIKWIMKQEQTTETIAFKQDGTITRIQRKRGKIITARTKTPNFYKNRKGKAGRLELSSIIDGNGGQVVDDGLGAE